MTHDNQIDPVAMWEQKDAEPAGVSYTDHPKIQTVTVTGDGLAPYGDFSNTGRAGSIMFRRERQADGAWGPWSEGVTPSG